VSAPSDRQHLHHREVGRRRGSEPDFLHRIGLSSVGMPSRNRSCRREQAIRELRPAGTLVDRRAGAEHLQLRVPTLMLPTSPRSDGCGRRKIARTFEFMIAAANWLLSASCASRSRAVDDDVLTGRVAFSRHIGEPGERRFRCRVRRDVVGLVRFSSTGTAGYCSMHEVVPGRCPREDMLLS